MDFKNPRDDKYRFLTLFKRLRIYHISLSLTGGHFTVVSQIILNGICEWRKIKVYGSILNFRLTKSKPDKVCLLT